MAETEIRDFSRNVVQGGKLLLWGEKKCEKRQKNKKKQNLLVFGGEISPPKGPEKTLTEINIE